MKLTFKDGKLVYAEGPNEGQEFVPEGMEEAIELVGVRSESEYDGTMKRLKSDLNAAKKLQAEAEAEANKEIPSLRNKVADLEAALTEAEERAREEGRAEYEGQVKSWRQKAEQAESAKSQLQQRYQDAILRNTIGEVASHPDHPFYRSEDLYRELREHAVFEEDKETGRMNVSFKVRMPDENGNLQPEPDFLDAKKAAEYVASQADKQHLIKGSSEGGPGGPRRAGQKYLWNDIKNDVSAKTKFVADHGQEKFSELVTKGEVVISGGG